MIDLTPLEVRKKKGDFRRTMRGYEPGSVDDFLELVADRLDELVRENLAHTERTRQLEQQLRDYKERESALTDALVSAQELREEMREQAVREAELARRNAEQDAERIRADVAREIELEEQKLRRLRARQAQLVKTYRKLLERELEEIAAASEALSYRHADIGAEMEPEQSDDMQEMEEEPEPAPAPRTSRTKPAVPPPAPEAMAAASNASVASDEQVADEELERSLEALQVVFARDQQTAEPADEAGAGRAEPPPDPTAFREPPALRRPYETERGRDDVPLAVQEDSEYELLLEDAIEEGDGARRAQSSAPARETTWLPKLIEDEP